MPALAPIQKAKVQPAGQGKRLESVLLPLDFKQAAPSATQVIFTIGPACHSVEVLSDILMAGGTCARIDLTWGPVDYHRVSLQNLAKAMLTTKRLCAVMLDTLGREVFVRREVEIGPDGWPKHGHEVEVPMGGDITLTTAEEAEQTNTVFPVNYDGLPDMVQTGDQLYIGRYLVTGADAASLYLEVKSKTATEIHCKALNEAKLGGLLTVFHMERTASGLTNAQNQQPLFAEPDVEAIRSLTNEFDIDFLSLSYTRSAEDVMAARALLNKFGLEHCKIIAKLDAKSSLVNFRGILNEADGIMLSRGNLGLDCLPEKVAVIQKNVTTSCNLLGKPCIVTRIVDTMVHAPRPTRAEATDVANAVLDGADCLMLGAETLRGMDPAGAVGTVVTCCHAAEAEFGHLEHFEYLMREAMKAQSVGIAVPGGADNEGESPDSSMHGSSAGIGEMKKGARKVDLSQSVSHANLASSLHAMTRNAVQNSLHNSTYSLQATEEAGVRQQVSFLAKLEAIASSAVRASEKANAKIIVVFTDTGLTAALVAKYRPRVPILTLVVPRLVNKDMRWKVLGRNVARQCLLVRGLVPMLAAPSPDGDRVLRDALAAALERGLVHVGDHAVCVEKISGDYCIKMACVDGGVSHLAKQATLVQSMSMLPQRM